MRARCTPTLLGILGLLLVLLGTPHAAGATRRDGPAAPRPAATPLDGSSDGDGQILTRQYAKTRPSSRSAASMTYDAARQEGVLFGGEECTQGSCTDLDDTWTWDGHAWSERYPAVSPPARAAASIVYDAATQQVVLFGGSACSDDANGSCRDFDDTWTWDGQDWTEQRPRTAPAARSGTGLVYDGARQHVLLFGGLTCPGGSCTYFDDTWTWDGQTWTQLAPAQSPSARAAASMLYQSGPQVVVLSGGRDCPQHPTGEPCHVLDDIWAWDGTTWINLIPASPPP